jgi:hypothetical protein
MEAGVKCGSWVCGVEAKDLVRAAEIEDVEKKGKRIGRYISG